MNSAADVWEKVKTLMEADMTSVSIDTWFGDAQAVALEDTRFLLCVSTDFKRDVIRSRFLPVIQKALLELFPLRWMWSCFCPTKRRPTSSGEWSCRLGGLH